MLLLLSSCALIDLPAGWEDAEAIEAFEQSACGDTGAVVLTATAADGGVDLGAGPVMARCQQALEGYWQPAGEGAAEVLIQPVDMRPDSVTKCACSYDLSMLVPTPAPVTLEVFQRGDRYGSDEEPEPWSLGTAQAE